MRMNIRQSFFNFKFFGSPTGTCFRAFVYNILILSLLLVMIRNKNQFMVNSEIYHNKQNLKSFL
jgi:hypothetical protein